MKSNLNLHTLKHEITIDEFENSYRSPGYRRMKIKLPDYVDSVMAVGHTLPAGGLLLYQFKWFLRQVRNVYYRMAGLIFIFLRVLNFKTPSLKYIKIETYIPPSDHIQFEYNTKTHVLDMDIVTAYERRSYRKITIIYISKQEDRNKVLESIGI